MPPRKRTTLRGLPAENTLRKNWPDFSVVETLTKSQRADIGAQAQPTGTRNVLKIALLVGGVIVLGMILARKPITSGAKMLVDKLKIKDLLSKYGNLTFATAPLEARPAALVKIYPSITSPEMKLRLDTIPLKQLWGVEGFYSLPPDTARVNSVEKIANTPAEFVALMKQPAINIAKKYGMTDPKIIVAQAGHEGGWGKSAIGGTNIFGHVATTAWAQIPGNKYSFENTWEDTKTGPQKTVRPFRVYYSLEQALDSHMKIIIAKWPQAIKATTPGAYADSLIGGKVKYATDTAYKTKLQDAYSTVNKNW
jgi:hypothetical protein